MEVFAINFANQVGLGTIVCQNLYPKGILLLLFVQKSLLKQGSWFLPSHGITELLLFQLLTYKVSREFYVSCIVDFYVCPLLTSGRNDIYYPWNKILKSVQDTHSFRICRMFISFTLVGHNKFLNYCKYFTTVSLSSIFNNILLIKKAQFSSFISLILFVSLFMYRCKLLKF